MLSEKKSKHFSVLTASSFAPDQPPPSSPMSIWSVSTVKTFISPLTATSMPLFEIFQYDFFIRAFIAGGITAVVAPLIGMFLVVRRYSLMADTLAHVSLVGVAIGIFTGINPAITALVTTVIAALGIERLRQTKQLFGESVLALFLSGGLAIAIVLISAAHGLNVNLFSYLF